MSVSTRVQGAAPRRIGLVLHPSGNVRPALERVAAWARERGIALSAVDDPRLPGGIARVEEDDVSSSADLVLALGGDGTMLTALRFAAPHGVPVMGVNLGRLGYLTEVDAEHLGDGLDALATGAFAVETRLVLRVEWRREGSAHRHVAYNDVVLTRVPGRGQAALGLRIDGQVLVRYASSGLIVATPAGSTAYSFSAGGPIVSPQTRAMIVTPDSPHGLFNRAVVLGDDEVLGVEVLAASSPVALEVDGRLVGEVLPGWSMEVRQHDVPSHVVRLGAAGFAERARQKLGITDPAAIADYATARKSAPPPG